MRLSQSHYFTSQANENGLFPATSVNKDVTVFNNCSPPSWTCKYLWEHKKTKDYLPSSSYLSTAPIVSPEETQDVKAQDTSPT